MICALKKSIQCKYLKYFKHIANDLKFKDILVLVSDRIQSLPPEIIWLCRSQITNGFRERFS